jgi:hypothetical protein
MALWIASGARQFVEQAATKLRGETPAYKRHRHLLALPIVGTGAGGGWHAAGEIVRELVRTLTDAAERLDVDVALVAWTRDQLAAAQHVRRELSAESALFDPQHAVPERLRATADEIARHSRQGRLVLFLGAGISVTAGLPTWGSLLGELADAAELDPKAKQALASLPVLDRASFLRDQFDRPKPGAVDRAFTDVVKDRTSSTRYSLTHALLASLDVAESITTNYDTLFEAATRATGRALAVLPYDPADVADRWLLKLHGCVTQPNDIVLTRVNYLRYADRRAALAGIVQSLLITRHMLFVGFSMSDENFLRSADQVKKAVQASSSRRVGEVAKPFGTALLIDSSPLLAHLWKNDVICVEVADQPPSRQTPDAEQRKALIAEASRQQEILLDYVLYLANQNVSHLLDSRYDGLLSKAEVRLRGLLTSLGEQAGDDVRQLPAWAPVARMFRSLGGENEPAK